MKKSLLALAILGVFAGAASAQSSVTMYGRIDMSLAKKSGTDNKEVSDGSAARLGLKGVEDLGSGLKAIFNIEHRFYADTGALTVPARFWQARAVVGLQGGFGQITLGREYTSAYVLSQNPADPWGYDTVVAFDRSLINGVDRLSGTAGLIGLGIGKRRNDNSLTYLFSASGFSAAAQIAAASDPGDIEAAHQKRPVNFGLQYAAGPIFASVGYELTGYESVASERLITVNGSYNFGVVKVGLLYGVGRTVLNQDRRSFAATASAPLGAGELRVVFGRLQQDFGNGYDTVNTLGGIGYHYALSKRTTVYVDFVRNTGATEVNGDYNKNGYDFGLKHNF